LQIFAFFLQIFACCNLCSCSVECENVDDAGPGADDAAADYGGGGEDRDIRDVRTDIL